MMHRGENCKIFLTDLEAQAYRAAGIILNSPHNSREVLAAFLHSEFVIANAMKEQHIQKTDLSGITIA